MKGNEITARHTVRKDLKGAPLETNFSLRVWQKIQKQQLGNYDAQGRWELVTKTVETPPEAATKQPVKKATRGRKPKAQ